MQTQAQTVGWGESALQTPTKLAQNETVPTHSRLAVSDSEPQQTSTGNKFMRRLVVSDSEPQQSPTQMPAHPINNAQIPVTPDVTIGVEHSDTFGTGGNIRATVGDEYIAVGVKGTMLTDAQSGSIAIAIRASQKTILSGYVSARQESADKAFNNSAYTDKKLHAEQGGLALEFATNGFIEKLKLAGYAGQSHNATLARNSVNSTTNNYDIDTATTVEHWQKITTTTTDSVYRGSKWTGAYAQATLNLGTHTQANLRAGYHDNNLIGSNATYGADLTHYMGKNGKFILSADHLNKKLDHYTVGYSIPLTRYMSV